MSIGYNLEALEALDVPSVLSFIFYPRKDPLPPLEGSGVREIPFEIAEGVTLGSIRFVADRTSPTILFFHGNGEIARDYEDIAPLYLQRGINLWVFDYRGYGRSTGTPSIRSMLEDAPRLFKRAREILDEEGLRGALWVMGRSLGSAPAIYIAKHHQRELGGLIVESGFANALRLLERLGLFTKDISVDEDTAAFNLRAIQCVDIPTLVIHGERDEIIPLEQGMALYGALKSGVKRLLIIRGAGHNDLLWVGLRQYMDAIESFLRGSQNS